MIFGCISLMMIYFLAVASSRVVRFTNLQCTELDPSFASIETCILQVLKRGVIGMNVHVKLHQIPVTNVSVNLSLHKKANGYRPFLYNISADFCKFMSRRKQNPILMLFFDAMAKDSNLNHTCPYDHDILVKNWVLKENYFQWVPLPEGEYMSKLKFAANNDWKAEVRGFFSLKEFVNGSPLEFYR